MDIHSTDTPDVCAVVVTYFPDITCAQNLESLASQVGKLLIVDNGSSELTLAPVLEAGTRLGADVIRLPRNLGIAAALNEGLRRAQQLGFAWLATFDQDSRATGSMIAGMLDLLRTYGHPERVAVITPRPVDQHFGFDLAYPGTRSRGPGWRLIPCAGTSGNLVNVRAAVAVGGFDDSLFIDYVDFEFCLRLRRQGYQVLEASAVKLIHSLGRMQKRRLLFKAVAVTNHPPLRRYYMTRNRLILWRDYWRREPAWVVRDIGWFTREAFYVVLFEDSVREKLQMIVRGIRDARNNLLGAYRCSNGAAT